MLVGLVDYVWIVIYHCFIFFFFFKQKTAYEMRISDWSSDVCSSDLRPERSPEDLPASCLWHFPQSWGPTSRTSAGGLHRRHSSRYVGRKPKIARVSRVNPAQENRIDDRRRRAAIVAGSLPPQTTKNSST